MSNSEVNRAFCRFMLNQSKADLREDVGPERAKILLERHMDVCGSPGFMGYFIHWVKYPGLLEEDIYMEGRYDNIDHARSAAIGFLLDHLRENGPKGACLDCGKELPWTLLTRDTIRCPYCGAIEHDFAPIEEDE